MPPIGDRTSRIAQPTLRRQAGSPQAAKSLESAGEGPQDSVILSPAARGERTSSVSEEQERAFLKLNKGRGMAVPLYQGNRGKPLTLTIHGINASPDSMKALAEAAAKRGESVSTFVYDDQKSRLTESSQDLAKTIAALQKQHPGQPLNISSHSMGSRIAVDALRQLDEGNQLVGKVNLQMINPMIGGHDKANYARMAPIGIDDMIAGVKPGKDMGTNSAFQKKLETTTLPASVKTTIYVGGNDGLVDKTSPRFSGVADGLNAKVVDLPGAGHDDALERVARR